MRLNCTALLLDDMTSKHDEDGIQSIVHTIVHSVLHLDQKAPAYGVERRQARVIKCRGQNFRGGYHDLVLKRGGVRIFPRLIAADQPHSMDREQLPSGNAELDAMLCGGMERGARTVLLGPAGVGKSLLSLLFLSAAISRGERAALFLFHESIEALTSRARSLSIDLETMRRSGALLVMEVDASALSPGEFASSVRACVDMPDVRTVVIDSLNGYASAMAGEALLLQIKELLTFLNRRGVSTFLTVAQQGFVGDTTYDVAYLADTVLLLRFFEARGQVLRAASVVKKRSGPHENTIREFRITNSGIVIGQPLNEFSGVLTGAPVYVGTTSAGAAQPPS